MPGQPQTFPCPNCNEVINDAMERCRYCSAPIDGRAAAEAAEVQSRVNRACSDASYLRTAAHVYLQNIYSAPLVSVSVLLLIFQLFPA